MNFPTKVAYFMPAPDFRQEFIAFCIDCGVLRFGDFVTKSGRNTPYFLGLQVIEWVVLGHFRELAACK